MFRPARGCSREGSAKVDAPRKDSAPWGVEVSKRVGWEVVVGALIAGALAGVVVCFSEVVGTEVVGEDPLDGDGADDLRPVMASQNDDMAANRRTD